MKASRLVKAAGDVLRKSAEEKVSQRHELCKTKGKNTMDLQGEDRIICTASA